MKIAFPRGDLYVFTFGLYIDGTQTVTEMDEIYFTVKRTYRDRTALLQKKLSDGTITYDGEGTYVVEIEPEDTDNMDFGVYEYDIEVVNASPKIKQTFVDQLELTREVTYRENEGGS